MSSDANFIDPLEHIESLRKKIYRLDDLTLTFARRFAENNVDQYTAISIEAWSVMHDIVFEILPHYEIRNNILKRDGAVDWGNFGVSAGYWAGPMTEQEQREKVFYLPAGETYIPSSITKHPQPLYYIIFFLASTFAYSGNNDRDILGGFHFVDSDDVLIIGTLDTDEQYCGILEFSVSIFCKTCLALVDEF